MKMSKIIEKLEEKYPLKNAEEWDNVGLLVGRRNKEIKKIQISLDITTDVLEKAVKNNIDLIISHHPFIFSPLKKINGDSIVGRKILTAVENNIGIYSMHTNLDSSKDGLNDYVGEKLDLKFGKIIDEIKDEGYGIGRLYTLENKEMFFDFLDRMKKIFSSDTLRYSGKNLDNLKVKKVAIVNGAGSSYWRLAKKLGADLLITGDVKYHEALDAMEENMPIIDIGHYESEHFFGEILKKELKEIENGQELEIEIFNEKPVFNKA